MDEELRDLIERFRGGMPMMSFMRSVEGIKKRGKTIPADPRLGTAVVIGRGRHTEGRDLMAVLLELYGFRTIVPNGDIDAEGVANLCASSDVSALCISIQSTNDIPFITRTAELLKEKGIKDRIVLNAGGTAVSRAVAERNGCDVYGDTALDSVESVLEEVLKKRSSDI